MRKQSPRSKDMREQIDENEQSGGNAEKPSQKILAHVILHDVRPIHTMQIAMSW